MNGMMRIRIVTAAALCAAVAVGVRSAAVAAPAPERLPANTWAKVADGQTGQRVGSVLVAGPDLKRMLLLGGSVKDVPYVQAFDPASSRWTAFSPAAPVKGRPGMHPFYQTACDPGAGTIYCLSGGPLYSLNLEAKTWTSHGEDPALAGLSWHAVAIDPAGRRLVVVGADKKIDNLGWTRTAILDLKSGTWSRLPLPDANVVKEHGDLVAATEAIIDLVGRMRQAWYRDPSGVGTDAELAALGRRCAALKTMPGMRAFGGACDAVAGLLAASKTLEALTAARALQRKVEVAAETQYPVPPSRRNAPLAFDRATKRFVLFGGDHEDYLMNDTWVLDLETQSWRRASPDAAPSPRAGHALVALPKSRTLALIGGYLQSSSRDYSARPWRTIEPRQVWTYDVTADRWDLLTSWQPKRGDTSLPQAAGTFYGYSAQYYTPLAVAADADDHLVLEARAGGRSQGATWMMAVDVTKRDAVGREKLATAPNQRLYRKGFFLASYGEVADPPKPTGIDALPANRWVKLPPVLRNFARGCRQRDWGTSVWNSANEEIILWGGGHCVRACSTPLHYSPASGRMVEGYDADEPYGGNGGGGFGSSVMNRAWVPVHGYSLYAYDPTCNLVVTATGFLYDPLRMDWRRIEPMKRPFQFSWGHTVLETSAHGVVAWGSAANTGRIGLWLFDEQKGWQDLKPQGSLFKPYCDSEGMTHDTKRDRMLLGFGGGYAKKGNGSLTSFDFRTRTIEKIVPVNADLGRIGNTREMVYVDHADWVVFAEAYTVGTGKEAKRYLRAYDCEKNRYLVIDAGAHPPGSVYSQGWLYDARRKLICVLDTFGQAYALRLDPKTAKIVEQPEDLVTRRARP